MVHDIANLSTFGHTYYYYSLILHTAVEPHALTFDVTGVPISQRFDVTLMICLIRNLTMVTEPINGFDSLPPQTETTPGSDLARIKWYRNKQAHHDSNRIDTAYFNTAWTIISDVSNFVHMMADYELSIGTYSKIKMCPLFQNL